MFYVGQKVVCVDDSDPMLPDPPYRRGMDGLTKGRIYTVRTISIEEDHFKIRSGLCLRVVEIVRPVDDGSYWAHRFRPVVERKTDISVFTAVLNPEKSKEPA